jgi:hypothetical protein
MDEIRFQRGPLSRLPLLDPGEPTITTEGDFFIGTPFGNVQFAKKEDVDLQVNQLSTQLDGMNVRPDNIPEADDTDRLQRAINKAIQKGVEVELGNRTYYISRTLAGDSHLYLTGNGAKIDYRGIPKTYNNGVVVGESIGLSIEGSFGNKVSLTADATEKTQTITVSDGSLFAKGDWVQIGADDIYPYTGVFTVKRAEIKKIRKVEGNVLHFTTLIYEGYTLANSAFCRKVNFKENVRIKGVEFVGSDADQMTMNNKEIGVALYLVKHFHVEQTRYTGQDYVGLRLRSCVLGTVKDTQVTGAFRPSDLAKGSVYYGVALQNNCQWILVENTKGETLRRLVVNTASQAEYGQPYHCIVDNAQFRDSHSGGTGRVEGFEHHGFGRFMKYNNLQTDSTLGGFRIEGRDLQITNCQFLNVVGSGVVFDPNGGIFENIQIDNILVTKAVEDGTSNIGYGLEVGLAPINRNVKISNFQVHGFASATRSGMRIIKNDEAVSENCSIKNSSIDSGTPTTSALGYGIWCEAPGWDFDDNEIYGYDQAIRMSVETNGNLLEGNKIKNPAPLAGSLNGAIMLYGQNVKSLRNTFVNCQVAHRSMTGSLNNKLHDNVYIGVGTPFTNGGTGNTETSPQLL